MSDLISIINYVSVSLFGSILSASFCHVIDTCKKKMAFVCLAILLPLLQGLVFFVWGFDLLQQIYPLVVHLPLLLFFYALSGKIMWPLFSILTAYLCCQLRRWMALLVVAVLSGGALMQDVAELLLTVPLLLILLRYAAPVVRQLSDYPVKIQLQFASIPAIYYVFDYLTTVYTDLLTSGAPVAVEFMPFVCCVAYLVFLLYSSIKERTQIQLEQTQKSLGIQLNQAVREIDALRQSQALARQYRHDMRHHLQYVSACMENGQLQQAKDYITGICKEIEAQKVKQYCENETANLILSAFDGRAQKAGIQMNVRGAIPSFITVSDSDLCVLLSNALENALHACEPLAAAKENCIIDVQFYYKESRLFLQIENPCGDQIPFENGVPVSHEPGHGIGVKSICAIVERYGGIYTFLKNDHQFILRLSL
ncbi:MAG: GHKL domain-containing protein [bacterium]|nr:GHKL domain-containing protein [bacterium]